MAVSRKERTYTNTNKYLPSYFFLYVTSFVDYALRLLGNNVVHGNPLMCREVCAYNLPLLEGLQGGYMKLYPSAMATEQTRTTLQLRNALQQLVFRGMTLIRCRGISRIYIYRDAHTGIMSVTAHGKLVE